jgi:hypothetical protein
MMDIEEEQYKYQEEEHDDTEFYEEVLEAMRARRCEQQQQRKNSNKWLDDDCTESTSSMSFLSSWASNTSSNNDDSWSMSSHNEQDARVYWNDLRQGKAPLRVLKKPQRHSDGGGLPDLLAKLKPRTSMPANTSTSTSFHQQDFGEHTESVRAYRFTAVDLHRLCFDVDGRDFGRLQKSLRNQGAVTNSLLKQVLPMVVHQSLRRQKARQLQETIELEQRLHLEPEGNQTPVSTTSSSKQSAAAKSPMPFLTNPFSFNKADEKKEDN